MSEARTPGPADASLKAGRWVVGGVFAGAGPRCMWVLLHLRDGADADSSLLLPLLIGILVVALPLAAAAFVWSGRLQHGHRSAPAWLTAVMLGSLGVMALSFVADALTDITDWQHVAWAVGKQMGFVAALCAGAWWRIHHLHGHLERAAAAGAR